jgi:hypothetical protein
VEETVSDNYYKAVQSVNPKNQYREVLLACSLAGTDERNQFPAAALRVPLTQILGRPMDIPAYAKHLSEFCKPERGPALVKVGARKNYKYFFVDPLLRPFAIIKGLDDQMLATRHLT